VEENIWSIIRFKLQIALIPIDRGLKRLNRHYGLGIAGGEGVHVGEDEVTGAVAAEGGFVFLADDGEGVQYVLRVFPGQAVEVEVERVEAGTQMAAFLFVTVGYPVLIAYSRWQANTPDFRFHRNCQYSHSLTE